jgi:competence protein ComEC
MVRSERGRPAPRRGPLRRRVGVAAARGLAELRARPLHLGLAALVTGLVASPRAPLVVFAALLVIPVLAGRTLAALGAAAALLSGAVLADTRLGALDATRLGERLGHATRAYVTLLDAPRARPAGGRMAVVRLGRERVLLRTDAGVAWPPARVGQELWVAGVLRAPGRSEDWLRARNVHAVLGADRIGVTGGARGGVAGALDGIRERAQHALERGLPPPQGALLRGMVLGQDEALPESMRRDFRAAGLAHLVAASGQNVMLLAALVFAACALAGVGLRARLAAALALVALYVPLAGGGPSIQRAGVMGAAALVATLAGRPAARWYALLLAAAVTLVLNPRAVEEPGWQMSFAAVAAILLLAARIGEPLRRRGAPGGLAEAAALTVAATIATAPLVALHFGRTSLASLPANLLAAPAVAPVMWLGMTAAALGQVSAAAAAPFAALAGYPLAYLSWLGDAAAGLPAAEVPASAVVVGVVCLAAAAAIRWRAARRPAAAATLIALAVLVGLLAASPGAPPPPSGLRVTFLDVGQGDATLIQHRSATVLVDAGPPDGGIVARLRRAGVDRIDVLVVTHAQADHDGGAAAVLRVMPVGLVLDGRDGVRDPAGIEMAEVAARRGVRRVPADRGQTLRVGRIELRVRWPAREPAGAHARGDPNERAVVSEARVGRFRMLLAADAESDVLSRLELRPVDVLKVAHHGSADPGLPVVLDRLRPGVAAIQVGARNRYGHPAPSTVHALRAAGAALHRTDRDGTIRLEERSGALAVTTHA